MKKLLMVLAFVGVATTTIAQEADPVQKYSVATNSFWSNWFIQGNYTWTAFYSNEERGAGWSQSPFKEFRRDQGFSVAIGKWFTPGLGLRTKFNGIWGKDVAGTDNACHSNKYWNIQEQALFNLSNLLCGYSSTRVWNVSPYAGVGVVRNCTYNNYELAASAGLLNQWRLSKRWQLNLDVQYNLMGDDFEGGREIAGAGSDHSIKNHDRALSFEVGFTYNLGKCTWEKTPDVDAIKALSQSQIDALNAQLNDANAENDRLKNELADAKNKPAEKVKEVVTTPVSVFFNLGKSTVASKKDLVNVRELAKYAADNDCNIVVTGFADSATGSKDINNKLSAKRAERVKNELVKMGVKAEKITTRSGGGVADLTPDSYNRRALVQIAE